MTNSVVGLVAILLAMTAIALPRGNARARLLASGGALLGAATIVLI